MLNLQFLEEIDKHSEIIGTVLSNYIPWQCEEIVKDGNCFFRCISKILSGSEMHHAILRQELCRFMVTDGSYLIQSYMSTKYKNTTTILDHLLSNSMFSNSIWATDVEIVAMSILLKTDIYVAEERFDEKRSWMKVFWLRYQGSPENTMKDAYIYQKFR